MPGLGQFDSAVRLGPSGFAFVTRQPVVTVPFHTFSTTFSTSVTLASYLLDDVTGIPLSPQALRPGLRVPVSLHLEGGAIAMDSASVEFGAGDASLERRVSYSVREMGEATLRIEQLAGFTAPARQGAVAFRVVPTAFRVERPSGMFRDTLAPMTVALGDLPARTEITVTSTDPARLLLSASETGPAVASLTVPSHTRVFLHALGGSGEAAVRLSTPNAETLEVVIPLLPLRVVLSGAGAGVTTLLTQARPLAWSLGISPEFSGGSLALRPGAAPVVVQLSSSDPRVVTVQPSTVELRPGAVGQTVQVTAVGPGQAELVVRAPDSVEVVRPRVPVSVRAPRLTLTRSLVGRDIQGETAIVTEGVALGDNVLYTVTSLDPSRLLLARTANTPGRDSITVVHRAGTAESDPLWLHSLAGEGEARLRITAEGFGETIATVRFTGVTLSVGGSTRSLVRGSRPEPFSVQVSPVLPLDAQVQASYVGGGTIRPGAGPFTVPVRVEDDSVLTVAPTEVIFQPGDFIKSVTLTPLRAGRTTVTAELPAGFTVGRSGAHSVAVEVLDPEILVSCANGLVVGKDMQSLCSVSGVRGPVTATADDPRVLVSWNGRAVGSGTATATPPAEGSSLVLAVQGLDSSGTVPVTLSAPGHRDRVLTVRLSPTRLVLNDAQASAPVTLRVGTAREAQVSLLVMAVDGASAGPAQLRPGAAPVRADLTSSDPAVLRVGTTNLAIAPGESSAMARLEGLAPGSAIVRLTTPPGGVEPLRDSALYRVVP